MEWMPVIEQLESEAQARIDAANALRVIAGSDVRCNLTREKLGGGVETL